MRILSNKKIFAGRIIKLYKTHLKDPAGNEILRETVVHPGAVAIIPLISKNKIILVRQFRYAAGRYLWELPAGTLGKRELPLACAKRELEEETGFLAGRLKKIMEFYTCPGFCTEKMRLYLAENLRPTAQKLDPDEKITYKIFNRSEIRHLVKSNGITDAKSLIGLILWLQKKI
ncbi:MAG: NUDIX hydrolase [Planctomycetes bacterium]|nr:NUDIX hydrolase [Planctomycetota bacterium]